MGLGNGSRATLYIAEAVELYSSVVFDSGSCARSRKIHVHTYIAKTWRRSTASNSSNFDGNGTVGPRLPQS